MKVSEKSSSRKTFLQWTAAVLTTATILKLFPGIKKNKKDTIKMLTQNGTLVEVDRNLMPGTKRKITDPELKSWIKK
ncbi:hypothetical protein BH10BAC3_BH10BAC3_28260 [soil metagenome]